MQGSRDTEEASVEAETHQQVARRKHKTTQPKPERPAAARRLLSRASSTSSPGRELSGRLSRSPGGGFQTYEEFKGVPVPAKKPLPTQLRSEFLSTTGNERVWDWMNSGEKVTEFSHFLDVCS